LLRVAAFPIVPLPVSKDTILETLLRSIPMR
jgi:hypothetical protein